MRQNEIILGDCIEVMHTLPDNSVDSIVTDPPYGLEFMGKDWDGADGFRRSLNKADVGRENVFGRASRTSPEYRAGHLFQEWCEAWAREALRVLKPGGHLLAFSGSRTYHRMTCAIENAGFEVRDQIMWIYGSGFPKSKNLDGDWKGWGTALKPAHEPICVARKPLVGTVATNVMEHGTGALNIDSCRVGTESTRRHTNHTMRGGNFENHQPTERIDCGSDAGRWPANVIHDGSDGVISAFPDAPGQQRAVGPEHGAKGSVNVYGDYGPREHFTPRIEDSKSAARFFYCAKASRRDRNEGCEHMVRKSLHWSSGDANPGSFQSEGTDKTSQNNHPTVKPTDLMAYLCRLVTPPGGLVLDPFMGSGSTGKACAREGFGFIGIDITPEYVEIARARIEHEAGQALDLPDRPTPQFDLFAGTTA